MFLLWALFSLCQCATLRDDSEFLNKLSSGAYEVVEISSAKMQLLSVSSYTQETNHPSRLDLDFHAFGNHFSFELNRDDGLFHPDYKELMINSKGEVVNERRRSLGQVQTDCYYTGQSRNAAHTDSRVIMSSCTGRGLQGVISLKNGDDWEHFELAPAHDHVLLAAHQTGNTHHIIFKVDDLEEEEKRGVCGVDSSHVPHNHPLFSQHSQSRHHLESSHHGINSVVPTSLTTTSGNETQSANKTVELMVFNDFARYKRLGNQVGIHTSQIVAIQRQLYKSPFFQTFNYQIDIQLVAQATFVSGDPYPEPTTTYDPTGVIEHTASSTLDRFTNWRSDNLDLLPLHDNGALYTGYQLDGYYVGLAWVAAMCDHPNQAASTNIIQATSASLQRTGVIAAHEMGHNFGALHDDNPTEPDRNPVITDEFRVENCTTGQFIMTQQFGTTLPLDWSPCTKLYMDTFFDGGNDDGQYLDQCLENPADSIWNDTNCGNGLLDDGEQCDCGATNCSIVDPCCNQTTCMLLPGANCSQMFGSAGCCHMCDIRKASEKFVCRPAVDSICDFPETCDGVSAFCPSDIFQNSGVNCTAQWQNVTGNNSIYNDSGKCYEGVCRASNLPCVTMQQTLSRDVIGKCPIPDLPVCGNLTCQVVSTVANQTQCIGTIPAPKEGLYEVADGTPCGTDKQCYAYECIPTVEIPTPFYSFSWVVTPVGECSVACGGGIQNQTVECQTNTSRVVPDSNCDGTKPDSEIPCNTFVCFNFTTDDWDDCSISDCEGERTRNVTCVRTVAPFDVVDDGNCTMLNITKPETTFTCGCDWILQNISECNVTCGGGIITRDVICGTNYTPLRIQNQTECNATTRPDDNITCNTQDCITFGRLWSNWTTCTKSCENGTQTRQNDCYETSLPVPEVVADDACTEPIPNPRVETRACNDFACPTYRWIMASDWTNCTQPCGGGTQNTSYSCEETSFDPSVIPNVRVVDPAKCNINDLPFHQRPCNTEQCPVYNWFVGEWGNCQADPCANTTTLPNLQTREVKCTDGAKAEVDESFCDYIEPPAASQNCSCNILQLQVYQPAPAQKVTPGDKLWIRWSYLNILQPTVAIILEHTSWKWNQTILRAIDPAVREYEWNVPKDLAAGTYRIRIELSPPLFAQSGGFEIVDACAEGKFCGSGICVNQTCFCTAPWSGPDCTVNLCAGVVCENGGVCNSAGKCNCTGTWGGAHCEISDCTLQCANSFLPVPSCQSCDCSGSSWGGQTCNTCNLACQHNGTKPTDGKCTRCICPDFYDGPLCETEYAVVTVVLTISVDDLSPADLSRFNQSLARDIGFVLNIPSDVVVLSYWNGTTIQFKILDTNNQTGVNSGKKFLQLYTNTSDTYTLSGPVSGTFNRSVTPLLITKDGPPKDEDEPNKKGFTFADLFKSTNLIWSIIVICIVSCCLVSCGIYLCRRGRTPPSRSPVKYEISDGELEMDSPDNN